MKAGYTQYSGLANTVNDHINHVRFIFQYRHQLTDIEYQRLSNLKLLYKILDKYYTALSSVCYLSDYYQPKYPLESIAKNLDENNNFKFIVSNYCEYEKNITLWRQFFLKINIVKPDGLEIITKFILPLIDNHQINEINTIQITRFMFSVLYNQTISTAIKHKLSSFLLLTNDGLKQVADCNLPDFYINVSESLNFLQEFKLPNLVSNDYCTSSESPEKWRQFLLNIGVKEINGLELIKKKIALLQNNKELINSNNVIKIIREIFNYHRDLSQEDFEKLSELPTLVKNGQLVPAIDSKIRISSHNTQNVSSFFKFLFTQYPSIPCIDKRCRKPSEIYSYSLRNDLINLDLPISAIEFPITSTIESFLGIKIKLDVRAYLQIIDNINTNFSQERHNQKLLSIYEKLSKVLQRGNSEDKSLINQWSKTGKFLGCDDQLHPINELYYLDSSLGLPYKRNPRLVKFPENLSNYSAFEYLLSILNVKKIPNAPGYYDVNKPCEILPQLIRDRVYYISVYLVNSTVLELVDDQSQKILSALDKLTISNPRKLYYSVKDIDYEEPFYNFYGSNGIFYVGRWNSRKNAKVGEYLIKALGLDEKKISSEKLLDFLDDPLDEIVSYLREGGFDIPDPSPDIPKDLNINNAPSIESEETKITSIISIEEPGKGYEPEQWGKFGENKAELFYQNLGYTVYKQPDGTGYDYQCVKTTSELFVEVKTINPNYNGVIRITPNEWDKMCKLDNQDKYELLIVLHVGELVTKMIRIKSAWKTLQDIFSKLSQQSRTSCGYDSNQIEVLIGLQSNSNNSGNDIIFNWKRLAQNATYLSSNIQEI
ncbi:DUF3883 domain-containing protein [Nostoc sp.]|uniref:DUF3883 domain-containing protein n=1 Tax=Nostoc sp. TaxID=1180 RepID=UPI002FF6E179